MAEGTEWMRKLREAIRNPENRGLLASGATYGIWAPFADAGLSKEEAGLAAQYLTHVGPYHCSCYLEAAERYEIARNRISEMLDENAG